MPLLGIDETRSYAKGTWSKHLGGLWVARAQTEGMVGWDCVVEGVAAVEVQQDDDLRSFGIKLILSTGKSQQLQFSVPAMIYRGAWNENADRPYTKGDTTTRDGSLWVLMADEQKAAPGTPNTDTGWKLAAKRGRDGRDGIKGEKGERGAQGRDGRDLTQTGDGKKW